MKNTHKAIGFYEIVGGVLGLWAITIFYIENNNMNNAALFFIIFVALFALVTLAGVYLVFSRTHHLSIVAQLIQVISFSIGGIEWLFNAGIHFSLRYNTTFLLRFFPFQVEYKFSLVSEESYIAINLIPFFLIIFLLNKPK
jgi:hypothetical protein